MCIDILGLFLRLFLYRDRLQRAGVCVWGVPTYSRGRGLLRRKLLCHGEGGGESRFRIVVNTLKSTYTAVARRCWDGYQGCRLR